jgi:hypothetical protein
MADAASFVGELKVGHRILEIAILSIQNTACDMESRRIRNLLQSKIHNVDTNGIRTVCERECFKPRIRLADSRADLTASWRAE